MKIAAPILLIAWTLVITPPRALAHVPGVPVPREVFVCASLLQLSARANVRRDEDFGAIVENVRRTHASPLKDGLARPMKSALKEVARDLRRVPELAFPLKQAVVGADAIRAFLADVTTRATADEDHHRPDLARHPFVAKPAITTKAFDSLAGALYSASALVAAGGFAGNGYPAIAAFSAAVGAACANAMASSVRSAWRDVLNADLLSSFSFREPPVRTTGAYRAHDFVHFAGLVRLALEMNSCAPLRWVGMRTRLPLSASARPSVGGVPRAPSAHEIATAVRRSGEFWFPYDARIFKLDLFAYFDVDLNADVLLVFGRES